MGIDCVMKRSLIIKGRRYYSPKHDEYVVAVKRGSVYSTFRRTNGDVVRLLPKNVCYVSAEDFDLCECIAMWTKMDTWFEGGFDEKTGTEYNHEWKDDRYCRTSYRIAILTMYAGSTLECLSIPQEYIRRFYEIVKGMGGKPYPSCSSCSSKESCDLAK